MYRYMREMRRKEALANKDIAWLVKMGLWTLRQGIYYLTDKIGLSFGEVCKLVTSWQLIGVVK
jgi:hypothetical protein